MAKSTNSFCQIVGLVVVFSIFSGVSTLAAQTENDEDLWKKLDITQDGWLDGKELDGGWLKFDADGDKEVTKAEFLAGRAKERGARPITPEEAAQTFNRLDVTGNGFLTGPELNSENARAYDANGDKVVTLEEFVAGYTKQVSVSPTTKPTQKAPALPATPAPSKATTTVNAPRQSTPPQNVKLSALTPKPGFIMGRAVFASGKPIPQFRASALGWAGELHLGPTGTIPSLGQVEGKNGRYEFRPTSAYDRKKILPEALVSVVRAQAQLSYKDRKYLLAMYPLDGLRDGDSKGGFRGYVSKGVVRDFMLKLHGPKIGYEKNTPPRDTNRNEMSDPSFGAFYGGTISLDLDLRSGGLPETNMIKGATVTITLTPDGPLLDGSSSQIVVRAIKIQDEVSVGYSLYFRDIPLGDYTANVTLSKPDGTSYPLRLKLLGGDWQNSAPIVFTPWDTIASVETPTILATR